jgi:hypothetical protein
VGTLAIQEQSIVLPNVMSRGANSRRKGDRKLVEVFPARGNNLTKRAARCVQSLIARSPQSMSNEQIAIELSVFSTADVLRLPNLGRKTLEELKSLMTRCGRSFSISTRYYGLNSRRGSGALELNSS